MIKSLVSRLKTRYSSSTFVSAWYLSWIEIIVFMQQLIKPRHRGRANIKHRWSFHIKGEKTFKYIATPRNMGGAQIDQVIADIETNGQY